MFSHWCAKASYCLMRSGGVSSPHQITGNKFLESRRNKCRCKVCCHHSMTRTVSCQYLMGFASTNANTTGPLRIELGGSPALILGQALGRQKYVFKLREIHQLQPLIDSAHYVVDTYLEAPASATLHFSSTTYSTIWFSLLVLSKLSLLFHPNRQQVTGVNKKHIQDKGAEIIQKFKDISLEEDGFWKSSIRAISTLLAWLEKSNTEARPGSASADVHTACDNSDSISQSSHFLGPNATHQPGWPQTYTPDIVASMNGQSQSTDDFDVHLWQQMLDSFTWFGPLEEGFGFGHYNM